MTIDPVSADQNAERRIRSLAWYIGFWQGYIEGERTILLIRGRKRFGAPPPAEREAELAAITDRARLERMAERIFDATGWDDLLATP
jgi:hypothetical protein